MSAIHSSIQLDLRHPPFLHPQHLSLPLPRHFYPSAVVIPTSTVANPPPRVSLAAVLDTFRWRVEAGALPRLLRSSDRISALNHQVPTWHPAVDVERQIRRREEYLRKLDRLAARRQRLAGLLSPYNEGVIASTPILLNRRKMRVRLAFSFPKPSGAHPHISSRLRAGPMCVCVSAAPALCRGSIVGKKGESNRSSGGRAVLAPVSRLRFMSRIHIPWPGARTASSSMHPSVFSCTFSTE
ncbi:hypothetical protein C8R45DRAFT_1102145 [Mycena sanguinolenta]|nr:hypothetical protein C8R45DRAFT_1102145 [Mycena sanguinolenta]